MFLKPSKSLRQAQSIRLPLLALGLIASLPSSVYSAENPAVNAAENLRVTTEMVIGSCPVDQFRNAYRNLIEDRELYNMSEAEKQMLLVCTERNAIVNDYIAAVENIIAKLQDLADLNTQTQDSPNGAAEPLETVNPGPSSGAVTSLPSQATVPEANPARSATPEAVEAQEQATGFLSGTNGCTPRYSVIATGGNAERNTAMIADERAGDSYHVTVGDTLPCGVKVLRIGDEVMVSDTLGDHVLPHVSDGWENNDAGGYADDEFIFFKIEVKQTEQGVDPLKTAPETKVFDGRALE